MINADTIKKLLKISGGDDDVLVDFLIPVVTDDILRITNNDFRQDDVYSHSDNLTFSAVNRTITCSNSDDFQYLHVEKGDDILVRGSLRNDGFYPVLSKTPTVITINTPFELKDEVQPSNARLIKINKIAFPRALDIPLSRMIGFHLKENDKLMRGISSESLGRHSVSYDLAGRQYPDFIYSALRPYMYVGVK